MSLEDKVELGRQAQQVHPLIERFFEDFQRVTFKKWEASESPEVREELHRQLHAAKALRLQIGAYITDGRWAEAQLEEDNGS